MNGLGEKVRAYAERFLTGDNEEDRPIKLKIGHTFRVYDEACRLIGVESFDEADAEAAKRAALLHDYGRFEQYRRFKTFHDAKSIDHGKLAVELVREHGLLTQLSPRERGVVLGAVRVHNAIKIPDCVTGRLRRIAGVVRDADKLDIIPILLRHLENPETGAVTWNLKEMDDIAPEVEASLRERRTPDYSTFRSASDFVVSKLAWVYDLNFNHTRREFVKREYLEKLRCFMPDTGVVERVFAEARRALREEA